MTWFNRAIDKRIQMKGVGGMQFNPLLTNLESNHNDKHLTRRMLENSVWYSGIEQDIAYFYKTEAPKFVRSNQESESTNYFWANATRDIRRIHSGFPQLISEKMVDLIIGNGYEIKVEGDNEVEYQEELDQILKDNKFKTLLGKSIETESWSGGVAWKLSWNPTLTEYPIIEAWQPENYTNVTQSGRVLQDIFFTYYQKNNKRYRLSEIYGVDKQKGAYIDYKLEQLIYEAKGQDKDARWVDVPMNELEETKDLKRIEFNGYFKRLSMYKPNKTPNSEFRYSMLGESDYAGSYGAFDAIDEIFSTWVQEFRDGKLHRYFPEELMLQDTNGKYNYPDEFKKDHILYADTPSDNAEKQKIQYSQGDLRTNQHIESYKVWAMHILNNAGLSPLTVGATGLESIAASEQSQQEREKVSIRTRNKKIGLWVEFLQDILPTVLEFRLMTKSMIENDDNTYSVKQLPEFDLLVTFNDYIIKSKSDRTAEVQLGLGTSWDILSAVKYVHNDKTEREQLATSARIKIEQGFDSVSQAELSALQAENIDTNEMLEEDGVEIIEVNENANRLVEPTNAELVTEETPTE